MFQRIEKFNIALSVSKGAGTQIYLFFIPFAYTTFTVARKTFFLKNFTVSSDFSNYHIFSGKYYNTRKFHFCDFEEFPGIDFKLIIFLSSTSN